MSTKRGLGSIRKLPSGLYQVRYTDPLGVRRNAKTTFKTKASAEFELTRIREAIENGTWLVDQVPQVGGLVPKTMTLKDLANHWRGQRVSSNGEPLRPNTFNEYKRLIESTLKEFADKPIRSITQQQIEDWLIRERARAGNQAVKAYKHLKTLMTYAQKRRWIALNPCDIERGTAYTSKEPEAPTSQQEQIMLDNAPEPFRTILVFAIYGGLRKGEIFELRRKDISEVKEGGMKWVRVDITRAVSWDRANQSKPLVGPPKTEAGIRHLLMPQEARADILKHLKTISISPEALLFPNKPGTNEHCGENKFKSLWHKIRALAGFYGRFHSHRTYASTEFAKLNPTDRELMERFGHRNIITAQKYQRTTGRESELLRGAK